MKSPISLILFSSIACSVSAPLVAAEFDAPSYHDSKCSRCHDTSVYTRENRRVNSLPRLQAQVARCDANLGTQLFPDDLGLLVEHLNTNYYKFDQ